MPVKVATPFLTLTFILSSTGESSQFDFIRFNTLLNEAADSMDVFTVSVVLKEDFKKIKLWTFIGEGSGVAGIVADDSWINFEGFQEDDSRNFVEVLQYLTQKPLV